MTLMRVNVDKRTNVGLTTGDSVTFAHGLGTTPDVVRIRYIATMATNHATRWHNMAIPVDATNVSVINIGSTTSPDFEVLSIALHSLIQ